MRSKFERTCSRSNLVDLSLGTADMDETKRVEQNVKSVCLVPPRDPWPTPAVACGGQIIRGNLSLCESDRLRFLL